MAESNADSRAGVRGDLPASSMAVPGADAPPRPGSGAGSDPGLGAAAVGPMSPASAGPGGPPGLARGWVLVAPAGVPAAALAPMAALLPALAPPRRWLAWELGAGVVAADPGAASWADAAAQLSRKSSDSGPASGPAAWVDPARLLAAASEQPGPWLWPLASDPGAFLGDAGCWAEALGAWRQPTLLLIPAAAASTGPAAAYAALLQRQGVPLIGLIQWGGPWLAADRRRDGLPWLGWLADPQDPAASQDQALDQDQAQDLALEAAAHLIRALQLASHRLDLD